MPIPLVCIGNLVAGGAGKTPLALAVFEALKSRFRHPHFLTRGYGGRLGGPCRVDPRVHGYRDVGDEALLLAAAGPTWIARDRPLGATAAIEAGADVIVMDDGFQNPSIEKDLALLAIDADYLFGNGRLLPAGPLRESPAAGFARAQGVVLIGGATVGGSFGGLPVARASLVPSSDAGDWAGRRVLAFAGIGRPEKFFATLDGLGAEIVATKAFADHHAYREAEIASLARRAADAGAIIVTTSKDAVRLPAGMSDQVATLPVRLSWTDASDRATIERLLDRLAGVA